MRPDEALAFLKKGAAQIVSEAELREKLALGRPSGSSSGSIPRLPTFTLVTMLCCESFDNFRTSDIKQFSL